MAFLMMFNLTLIRKERIDQESANTEKSSSDLKKPRSLLRRLASYLLIAIAYLAVIGLISFIIVYFDLYDEEFINLIFE